MLDTNTIRVEMENHLKEVFSDMEGMETDSLYALNVVRTEMENHLMVVLDDMETCLQKGEHYV